MAESFLGWHTIYGAEGEHTTPYMTRIWIGHLRLHVFHRGDADPDPHDHPWDFWTFPLTPYVEEVAYKRLCGRDANGALEYNYRLRSEIVDSFRWSYRPATYCHRVLGRYERDHSEAIYGPKVVPGRIVTLVWRGGYGRTWGFLRNRDGQWCWTPWREYVFGGGKHAPCEPPTNKSAKDNMKGSSDA